MKYTKKASAKSTVTFTLKLDSAEWAAAIEKAYQKTKGKYSVPGFRKGKVPKKVIEQMYGEGVFFEEAVNIALPEYYGLAAVVFGMKTLLLTLMIKVLRIPDMISKIVAEILFFISNYFIQKKFIFKKKAK